MNEVKYFYKGIPLAKYCHDNKINISTIRARIWKKKHNEKYKNMPEQDIVNMVVEAYGSNNLYMYKGMSLRQYCLANGIDNTNINKRIRNLKADNPNKSNDELVIMALENFENRNYKYFYQGMPLVNYCTKHPEIKYSTIKQYIQDKKKKKTIKLSFLF